MAETERFPVLARTKDGDGLQPRAARSFAGFLHAVQKGDRRTLEKVYGSGYSTYSKAMVAKAAMSESSGTAGGFVVPVEYSNRLFESIAEESFIFPRATVVPMTAAETLCPRIDAETVQSAGVSPFFGGMTYKWGSERAPDEAEPTFRQLSLKAYDLLGYAIISNQMLQDLGAPSYSNEIATNVMDYRTPEMPLTGEDYLIKLFGSAAAWHAEYAFLRGTGSGQLMPLGILNAPAAVSINRINPNQVVDGDVANMIEKLIPFGWKRAVWACHTTVLDQVLRLTNYQMNIGQTDNGAHFGWLTNRPLFVTEKLPALGTKGDLILFDPSLYVIGARTEVLIDVSEHNLFRSNQAVFRVWLRLDGKPWLSANVTLQDGATTASAYIILS